MRNPFMAWVVSTASVFAATSLAAQSASAQSGDAAFSSPATRRAETGGPTEAESSTADQVFLREAALGNRGEIDLAKLATQRASSAAVKEFANRMASDHGNALKKIESLARASGTPLPGELDADHQLVRKELEGVDAGAFDVAYMREQIDDHQRTAQLLQYEVASGENDAVRKLAGDMLPVVLEHLEMAKAIHAQLTGAS